MSANDCVAGYDRRLTPVERLFTRSPFAVVTMVARIRGSVTEAMVRNAVSKVRQRHPHLRARIVEDGAGAAWMTSEGAKDIPVVAVPRESEDHWIRVVQESCQDPFEFSSRPAIRFTLIQSSDTSDLVILCHHIICDGLSLAYLARDLMVHLGDPAAEPTPMLDAAPLGKDNMPEDVSLGGIVRFVINRMNSKWEAEKVVFDQEDYRNLTSAYWMNYQHQVLSIELTDDQTSALVQRCRDNGVTVNSALSAAFVGAQALVRGAKPFHPGIGVAASLRDRLPRPVGEAMGFYAGMVRLNYRPNARHGFWDNARQFHQRVRTLFTNRNLFREPLTWCYLEPTILEAINFKRLGGLVPKGYSRHEKLAGFSARDDVVLSILKRDKMDRLDRIIMGTAVTNLGRMNLPREYGALRLDRLIVQPGGAFPLATVNLVLGAVTHAGRLSLTVEFVEDNVSVERMEEIRDRALLFLLAS